MAPVWRPLAHLDDAAWCARTAARRGAAAKELADAAAAAAAAAEAEARAEAQRQEEARLQAEREVRVYQ